VSLRVLVVDDSAVVREMTSLILTRHGMQVETAADPIIARRKMELAWPDVLLLDLEMPRMDGLTFLRQLMQERPLPVVVCSGLAAPGTESALRALEEGAVALVEKPRLGVRDFLEETASALSATVQEAAEARPRRAHPPAVTAAAASAALQAAKQQQAEQEAALRPVPLDLPAGLSSGSVIALGASTGGPQAIELILGSLPAGCPPLVLVQHMPEAFTGAFARRLDSCGKLRVKEAAHGDRLLEGQALIAPGNRHLRVLRDGQGLWAALDDGPAVTRHRPSVDVLFDSVAEAVGRSAVAALLTGMGEDGARGLLKIRSAGGATLAQDEASSVVFGMPGQAAARGAAEELVPLEKMPEALLRRLQRAPAHG
jgi:two-component system chemotaxis response regulator CheB